MIKDSTFGAVRREMGGIAVPAYFAVMLMIFLAILDLAHARALNKYI
jgi:hypothetical protein